jgi:hypothetical protein
MALKRKITKDEFGKLPADLKTEYVEDGDGYKLDLSGDDGEDTGALKRAKDRETQLRRDAEKALKEAQEKLDALGTDDARKKGDIETLEKKWAKDLADAKAAGDGTITKQRAFIEKSLVGNTAKLIAKEISKSPALMERYVRDRLSVDFDGDEPTLRILDATGKVSALDIDGLKKEIVANKEFGDIVIVSQASGGAAKTKTNGGAGNPDGLAKTDKPADLSSMNPRDLAAALKERQAETQQS